MDIGVSGSLAVGVRCGGSDDGWNDRPYGEALQHLCSPMGAVNVDVVDGYGSLGDEVRMGAFGVVCVDYDVGLFKVVRLVVRDVVGRQGFVDHLDQEWRGFLQG